MSRLYDQPYSQYNGVFLSGGSGWSGEPRIVPPPAPKGVPTTAAIHAKAGWLGQVLVDGVIVWESKPKKNSAKAHAVANRRIQSKLAEVFA